jgi:hypothetical protein
LKNAAREFSDSTGSYDLPVLECARFYPEMLLFDNSAEIFNSCAIMFAILAALHNSPCSTLPYVQDAMKEALQAEFVEKFPAAANELGPESLARLLEVCVDTQLPAERRLFRDRMPVDSVYLVLEGELRATIDDSGHSVDVGMIGPGDWLGEVAVLSGNMTASSTVTTVTPCRVLKLRAQDFERLALHDEDISHVLMGQLVELLAGRLRTSNASALQLAENR